MRAIEFLSEKIVADLKLNGYNTLPVISKPSPMDLKKILNKQYPSGRFFLFDNDLLLWDGSIRIHHEVADELGINESDIIAGGSIEPIRMTKEEWLKQRQKIDSYQDGTTMWEPHDMSYFDYQYEVIFNDYRPTSSNIVYEHPLFKRMIKGIGVTTIEGDFN